MCTLRLNNSSNGAATVGINASEIVDVAGEPDNSTRKLARLLFASGFVTLVMDAATALYKPPRGVVFGSHQLAYYLTLAGIFAAGLAEVSTAFWLSRYGRGRGSALARAVLCASTVPLVAVVALGGFSVIMK